MKKRLLALLSATVIAGVFVGCGSGSNNVNQQDTSENAQTTGTQNSTEQSSAKTTMDTLDIFINMSWYPVSKFEGIIPDIIKSKTVVEKCSGKHKKVPDKDRKLSPHSFRFTYNTFMVYANFPQEVLRNMIGHNSVEMTDYYTRTNLDANLEGLKKYQDKINEIWDQKM